MAEAALLTHAAGRIVAEAALLTHAAGRILVPHIFGVVTASSFTNPNIKCGGSVCQVVQNDGCFTGDCFYRECFYRNAQFMVPGGVLPATPLC